MRRRKPWWIKSIHDLSPQAIVRLKSQDGRIGENWWAQEFVRILEDAGEKGRLMRARTCGRNGGGSNLSISGGKMNVGICCSGYTIREVMFWFPEFKEDIWNRLVDIIASDATLTGSLLSGDFSEFFADALKCENIILIPEKYTDIRTYCNCGDDKDPCIHVAVAWYLLAEALDKNPWYIFTLYGLSREEITRRVSALCDIHISAPTREIRHVMREIETDTPVPIPSSVNPIGFFLMSGDVRTLPVSQLDTCEINPITLLGSAPFRLGGKDLGERISLLYPVIQKYAGDIGREGG